MSQIAHRARLRSRETPRGLHRSFQPVGTIQPAAADAAVQELMEEEAVEQAVIDGAIANAPEPEQLQQAQVDTAQQYAQAAMSMPVAERRQYLASLQQSSPLLHGLTLTAIHDMQQQAADAGEQPNDGGIDVAAMQQMAAQVYGDADAGRRGFVTEEEPPTQEFQGLPGREERAPLPEF